MKGTSSGRDAYLRRPKSRDVYWSAANGMPRNLLITSENGRALTTYGVNRSGLYTMKFAFLVCVILISGCVFVSGDLEIYPGVEQEDTFENREQPSNFFDRFYLDPRWRASIPWADQDQDYYKNNRYINAKLSERVRQLEEFVNRRRQQLKEEAEKNAYLNIRLPGSEEGEEYGKLPGKNFEHYQLKYPNQQILDDVRPYPHEENDFTFRDEEGEEKEKTLQSADLKAEKNLQFAVGKSSNDDDEFAYGPTDPRYYEDTPSYVPREMQEERSQRPIVKVISSTDGSGHIVLTQRNEAKFPLGQLGQFQLQKHDNTVEVVAVRPHMHEMESAGVYIIAIVAGISAAATVGLIAFAIGWYNLQKHVKNAADVEYPAYGVTGPNKEVSPSGDRRLAQSAQMYHYQHQKQQIIAMESRAAATERHGSISEADSDEENEEGDYTVYECPGLAPTGEMEVKNPLFQDDPTPAQTPQVKQNDDGNVQKK